MVTFYLYDDTPNQAAYAERLQKAVEKYQVEGKIITFTYRNTMLKHIKKNPRQADHIFMTADGAKVLHDYPRNEWLVCW